MTAIKATHPDLYARFVDQAMQSIAERTKPLSYRQQLQVDVLMGKPVSQAAQAGPSLSAIQPPPPPQGRPPGSTAAPDVASASALKGTPLAKS